MCASHAILEKCPSWCSLINIPNVKAHGQDSLSVWLQWTQRKCSASQTIVSCVFSVLNISFRFWEELYKSCEILFRSWIILRIWECDQTQQFPGVYLVMGHLSCKFAWMIIENEDLTHTLTLTHKCIALPSTVWLDINLSIKVKVKIFLFNLLCFYYSLKVIY